VAQKQALKVGPTQGPWGP